MARSAESTVLNRDHLQTPIGTLLVVTDARARLVAVDFDDHAARMARLLLSQRGIDAATLVDGSAAAHVRAALARYFEGALAAIDTLEVAPVGTPFQRAVWAALRTIPAGETRSYGALASAIGRPAAVRAVGLANGSNPVGVVVPCHRVIGADRTLTGYGGGLARKRWLLAHEGARIVDDPRTPRRARVVGRESRA